MNLKLLPLSTDDPTRVPKGYEVLQCLAVPLVGTDAMVLAVLQELEPTPNLVQLIQAAEACPPGRAVGVPGELLREALRELGYPAVEPSPVQPVSVAEVKDIMGLDKSKHKGN